MQNLQMQNKIIFVSLLQLLLKFEQIYTNYEEMAIESSFKQQPTTNSSYLYNKFFVIFSVNVINADNIETTK